MNRTRTFRIARFPVWLCLAAAVLNFFAWSVFVPWVLFLSWPWWGSLLTLPLTALLSYILYYALRWRVYPDDGTRCRWCGVGFPGLTPPRCPECRRELPAYTPRCHRCGYQLTGNVSGRCPECGTPAGLPPERTHVPWSDLVAGFLVGAAFALVVMFVADDAADGPVGTLARVIEYPGIVYVRLLDSVVNVYPPELARMCSRANVAFYGVLGAIIVSFARRQRPPTKPPDAPGGGRTSKGPTG